MTKTTSQALVPQLFGTRSNVLTETLGIAAGVLLISLLAQVAIPLPWTPVPITGQTLGVSLVALSWGWKRSSLIMLAYLLIGAMGAPIFALGKSGMLMGPTFGYLAGMAVASVVVGILADRGWTTGFFKSLAAAYLGSVCIFTGGLFVLSFYVPTEALLMAGLWPFLAGDLIKNLVSASTSTGLRKVLPTTGDSSARG